MTPMQQQANAVLNALDEGAVSAVIRLYDVGMLGKEASKTRRENIMLYLTHPTQGLNMTEWNAKYWLNWFGVKDNR